MFFHNVIAKYNQDKNGPVDDDESQDSEFENLTFEILRMLPVFVMKDFLNLYTERLLEYNAHLLDQYVIIGRLE